ncbi:MAG: DUF4376 domain-containing protein [Rhodocyclaceae bacterium]|nr:DUF4376 domain-containing protein [Rhodocyclaceae bacterium]
MPHMHNGVAIADIRQGVTIDDVFYLWPISPERQAELGIVWEDDPASAPVDDRYYFNNESGLVRKEHADIVASIFDDVKKLRDAATQTGGYPVEHNGTIYWFHSDAYSLIQQQGLIAAAMSVEAAGGDMSAPLIPVPWKTLGGIRVPMTATLALKLLPASFAQQGAIFNCADVILAQLEAAEFPETVDIHAGWPAVYRAEAQPV